MRQIKQLAGGVIAEKFNIIGTAVEVAKVWEPREGHSTITSFDGAWYGQIGTERLPAELETLPCGDERYAAVKNWQAAKYARAYALILQAFPEMEGGRYDMGDITVW
jgi:hypothetical protein